VERKAVAPIQEEHQEARAILRAEALFECLSDDQLDSLVRQSRVSHFGRGERVIREGAEGDSMFILLQFSVLGRDATQRLAASLIPQANGLSRDVLCQRFRKRKAAEKHA